jgi:hypothetical protein
MSSTLLLPPREQLCNSTFSNKHTPQEMALHHCTSQLGQWTLLLERRAPQTAKTAPQILLHSYVLNNITSS